MRYRSLLLAVALLTAVVVGSAPAAAQAYIPISGEGSTWSANALDQWRKNVQQYGMKVTFTGTGSTQGRNQFKTRQVDFAVSEIPYGRTDNNVYDEPPKFGYAYMPIVAGGTALMYNLKIGRNRVTNLRLSGDTVAKIFTGVITKWDDPAIKADNPGLALPARKVIPVVRSDGSGTSAQFTEWMSVQHSGIWNDFCRKAGKSTPCGFTSNYPLVSPVIGQNGSLGVANYVRQEQSEGAITYVEYSYARNARFPVAKLLNAAGYYIEPTSRAVAVALLQAKIKPDLTQDLRGVYNDDDARTYPLSSYSYMILPTEAVGKFTPEKGRTLSDFAYYFLCEGQHQAERLGFSPLPVNLVDAGMDQVAKIPGSTRQQKDLSKCNNPTFSKDGSNTLAKTAPQPPACDKKGPTQCTSGTGGARDRTPISRPGADPGSDDPADDPAGDDPADPDDPANPDDPADTPGGDKPPPTSTATASPTPTASTSTRKPANRSAAPARARPQSRSPSTSATATRPCSSSPA
ncbi:phosphate ABC transporter substrate-binding protein PstS [Actinokineospora soli]|uniref:Phosphate ABC transporter substrate-binding protein PstS n=1 Tax=Actinokineospora soli TaxID=1048753 RepID=A0ABW2TJK8_9PSEU